MRLQRLSARLGALLVLAAVGVLGFSASAFAEGPAPTGITTELHGSGESGVKITVLTGTEVFDSVTVTGKNVSNFSGEPWLENHTFYSATGCSNLVDSGAVNLGYYMKASFPELSLGVFERLGTYYVQWNYVGNSFNDASETACGSEVVTVVPSCTTNTGRITLSPGLTETAAVQTMKIKGTLTGCAAEPFTAAKYTATLTTSGPVSCSALKATYNEPSTGAAKFVWTPKAKPSKGTLSLFLTETPGVPLVGNVTTGSYSPLTLSGPASERYSDAATCGVPKGRKGVIKAVTKGAISG